MKTSKEHILELVFFDLFQKLRMEEGFPLDYEQYDAFLHAFVAGWWRPIIKSGDDQAIKTRDALFLLCRALWVPRERFYNTFKKHFDTTYEALAERYWNTTPSLSEWEKPKIKTREKKETLNAVHTENTPVPEAAKSESSPLATSKQKKEENAPPPDKKSPPPTNAIPETSKEKKEVPTTPVTTQAPPVDLAINYEETRGKRKETSTLANKTSIKEIPFLFSDDKHLPVSYRKAQNAIKRLRNFNTRELSDRINVKATVKHFAIHHFLESPKFEWIKKDNNKILILEDHLGLMVPFKSWGDHLYHILKRENKVQKLERFYFYKYPTPTSVGTSRQSFRLFNTPYHTATTTFEDLIKQIDHNTLIFIFSDGGALTRRLDHEHVSRMAEFLDKLTQRHPNLVWINPLEKEKWKGTSAMYLSFFAKMVPFSEAGLYEAINSLR